jgi:hypothetical protein
MTDAATDAIVVPISAASADGVFRLKDIQVGKTDSRGLKITYSVFRLAARRAGLSARARPLDPRR